MFYRAPFFGMPRAGGPVAADDPVAELIARLREEEAPELAGWPAALEKGGAEIEVLRAVLGHSPFLTRAAFADLGYFRRLIEVGPDALFTETILHIKDVLARETDEARLARGLRIARRKAALAIAFADLTDHWPLERVTHALSDLADAALSAAIRHLLLAAHGRGEIALADRHFPEDGCGYVILAMGKYGARELNYSSDIDLIALYEPARVDYRGSRSVQQFFVGLTQKLGRLINDRIGDGYVFRVDWRLRPDPGATPLAVSFGSARAYYAERGETWERAAMIKARPAAGDIALGRALLAELASFVWPGRMDFWALGEIRRLKQRINEHRGGAEIGFLGHNVKLGRGGIREIEFYAQTQQLIYGATDPYLRCQKTLDALSTLSEAGYVDEAVADELTEAYEFLRQLEHRLQMVNDQQTQTLPADEEGMARIAGFMGYDDSASLREALFHHLHRVSHHYQTLFADDGGDAGIWDFSNVMPNAEMAALLADAGFSDSSAIYAVLRRWVGQEEGTDTADSRGAQALTSLVPRVVEAARKHAAKDHVIAALDRFVAGLDREAAAMSLLAASPKALDTVVSAAARAPALLRLIEARPGLLQHLAERETWLRPPGRDLLMREVSSILSGHAGEAERMSNLSALHGRVRLQLGIATMQHAMTAIEIGRAMADLYDAMMVAAETDRTNEVALIAACRLGACEATALDLGELVLLFENDRAAAEHASESLAARLAWLDADGCARPVIVSVEALQDGSMGDRLVPLLLGLASARPLVARDERRAGALREVAGRLAGTSAVRAELARRLLARQQVLLGGAGDAERLIDDPAAASGGLDDIMLLTGAVRLLAARQSLEAAGLSAAAARAVRQAHFQLRQIENYRRIAVADEPLGDDGRAELDKALALAIGVEDRADLTRSMQAAIEATRAGFAEIVARLPTK